MPDLSTILPAQWEGVTFLSLRDAAVLADDPGYGKTAQAVLACDDRFARTVLVVTTASARSNWLNEFRLWSSARRPAQAVFGVKAKIDPAADVVVVAWSIVAHPAILAQLLARTWDVLVLDESHYAKAREAKRTCAVFGGFNDDGTRIAPHALVDVARATWCLTGTPMPNSPADLYPVMRALFPDTLAHVGGRYDRFEGRYCVVRLKPTRGRPIKVIVRGQNEDELRALYQPLQLRRLATDLPPLTVSQFALDSDESLAELAALESELDAEAILDAAAQGRTLDKEQADQFAKVRRLTGAIKARAAVAWLSEELEGGTIDKVVVFRWHTETGRILREGLSRFGLVSIDGSTPGPSRDGLVRAFQTNPAVRVFEGQIQAAGEAITLHAACQTVYVESSIVPSHMEQSVRRTRRRGQRRPCYARIAMLPGSIDERIQEIVTRKLRTIAKVIETESESDDRAEDHF